MSQLQAIGMLLCGLAIVLSLARTMRRGQFGAIVRSDDPIAFWGITSVFAALAAGAIGLGALELTA